MCLLINMADYGCNIGSRFSIFGISREGVEDDLKISELRKVLSSEFTSDVGLIISKNMPVRAMCAYISLARFFGGNFSCASLPFFTFCRNGNILRNARYYLRKWGG
jgi:hypothetical protein